MAKGDKPIEIKVSRAFSTTVVATQNVQACAQMFGIGLDETVDVCLYKDLKIKIGAGHIIYITGDSGAGKTSLLRDIRAALEGRSDVFLVDVDTGAEEDDLPVLDRFGDLGLEEICGLLAYVGISEPFVYLRRPRELSDGQRYRYRLARLIHAARQAGTGRFPVVIVDEFLATLDRTTARVVARQIRKASMDHGICFVAATTHDDIQQDLAANTRITMRLNYTPRVERVPAIGYHRNAKPTTA